MRASGQLIRLGVVGALSLAVFGYLAHSILSPQGAGTYSATTVQRAPRDPSNPDRVEVQVPLLADYYNHTIENAPPRNEALLRRREFGNSVPRRPADIAARVGATARLRQWITAWERGELTGADRVTELEATLRDERVGFAAAAELGRAMHYLDGEGAAAACFRVALDSVGSGDVKAEDLTAELDQMNASWRCEDWVTLEKRFSLCQRVERPFDASSRRAGYLSAEMAYHQGRYEAASSTMMTTRARHEHAGDLTPSDKYEMDYVCGLMLFYAGHYSTCVPYLKAVVSTKAGHEKQALPLLALALVRSDSLDAAAGVYDRLCRVDPANDFAQAIRSELAARRIDADKSGQGAGNVASGRVMR